MSIDNTGPVLAFEAHAIVQQLRDLAERSAENHQATFHFIFAMAAESLSDNVGNAVELDADAFE